MVATNPESTSWLNLELIDSSGDPLAGRRYTLSFDDGPPSSGTLDGAGRLALPVPTAATCAELVIAERTLRLKLGALAEPRTIEGAQERLNQLNFFVGNVDGELGDFTAAAIKRFQEAQGLEPTGELNPDTVQALQQEHGT